MKFNRYTQEIIVPDDVLYDFGVTDNIQNKGIVLPDEEENVHWLAIGGVSATVVLAAVIIIVPLKRKTKRSAQVHNME
jgi:hypothetical protein